MYACSSDIDRKTYGIRSDDGINMLLNKKDTMLFSINELEVWEITQYYDTEQDKFVDYFIKEAGVVNY